MEEKIKANDVVVFNNCHEFETHSQSLYPQVSMWIRSQMNVKFSFWNCIPCFAIAVTKYTDGAH